MIKKEKRAESVFGMSFGMIFSIFIIVMIIIVAFYAINYFLDLNKCAKVGLFYEDLQDEIDRAWNSGDYKNTFDREAPEKIETICFGNVSVPTRAADYDSFQQTAAGLDYSSGANIFLYPPEKACDESMFSKKLEHFKSRDDKFFCLDVNADGKISFTIEFKDTENNLAVLD